MTIFITIFEQNRLSSWQSSTKLSEVNVKDTFTSHIDKKIFLVILTYLKEKLKYCLKKCLFISVGVIEN
jgi:hypothetical protein